MMKKHDDWLAGQVIKPAHNLLLFVKAQFAFK
jgi:hypothetical protein